VTMMPAPAASGKTVLLRSALVRELTPAPDVGGWTMTERLLTDLAPLDERLWLVIDDLHELGSAEARRQLELLVMRAPEELRFVLCFVSFRVLWLHLHHGARSPHREKR
jgi:LuxR family transcriptional regulator, maltose regulon positive regulatory protein